VSYEDGKEIGIMRTESGRDSQAPRNGRIKIEESQMIYD